MANIVAYRGSHPEVFCRRVFLKMSEISQENTCVGGFFLKKLQASFILLNIIRKPNVIRYHQEQLKRPATLLKKETST